MGMSRFLFPLRKLILIYECVCMCTALPGSGNLCLSCDKVIQPRDCNVVTRCGSHEECMVEKFVTESGIVWYNVGCMSIETCTKVGRRSSQVTMCLNCCSTGDLCNRQGCGASDFDHDSFKTCYSCSQHQDPDSCDEIEVCSQNKQCALIQEHFGPDSFYESLCTSPTQCGHVTSKGVVECCNGSLCNDRQKQLTTEQPTVKTTPAYSSKVTPTCPTDWIQDGSSSRYCSHRNSGTMPWTDAKSLCEQYGTHLPVVVHKQQLDTLSIISQKKDIWLDGTDQSQEGHWIWSSTGKLVPHLFWAPNEPDHYFGDHSENCLEFGDTYGLLYNDAPCTRHLDVICEDGYFNSDLDTLLDCPSGTWQAHGGRLYCVIDNRRISWFAAKNLCRSLHAHLPIVNSDADHIILKTLIQHGEIWLDGTELTHHSRWTWQSTGADITYSHWSPGQPDDYLGNPEECLEFGEVYNWMWNDAPCNDTTRATKVICQRQQPGFIFGK